MLTTVPLFGALPAGPELIIIVAVIVLLFGANKIPKLARSSGQAMGEFKKGREEVEEELQEMKEHTTGGIDTTADDSSAVESAAESETETESEK